MLVLFFLFALNTLVDTIMSITFLVSLLCIIFRLSNFAFQMMGPVGKMFLKLLMERAVDSDGWKVLPDDLEKPLVLPNFEPKPST